MPSNIPVSYTHLHGVITDIVFAGGVDVDNRKKVDIPVVMMAGGLGTRLYPCLLYTSYRERGIFTMGKEAKTNAMRMLERAKVNYTSHEYPHERCV